MDEINPTQNYLSFSKLFEKFTIFALFFKKSIGKQSMIIHHKNIFKMIASLGPWSMNISAIILQDELKFQKILHNELHDF